MSLRYTGEKRAVEISIDSWDVHANFIIEWANGVQLEQNMNQIQGGKWFPVDEPTFNPSYSYRIAKRKPQAGEVYVWDGGCDEDSYALAITHEGRFLDLNDGTLYAEFDGAEYAAPSAKAYYAREMLEDYENQSAHLLVVVQAAAKTDKRGEG